MGLPPISTIGFGRKVVSSDSLVPKSTRQYHCLHYVRLAEMSLPTAMDFCIHLDDIRLGRSMPCHDCTLPAYRDSQRTFDVKTPLLLLPT